MVESRPRRRRNRWVGWTVAVAILATFGGLGWLASRVPVVDAAGNPLYLHGSGTAPGCVPTTLNPSIGNRATACALQTGVTATWAFTNLPAQTISAGIWSFTMNWDGGTGNANNTVAVTAGVSATASCAGFLPIIPIAGTTWTDTFGSSGANPNSPFTVNTSGSQPALVVPPGGSLCLSVIITHNTGGPVEILYDGGAGTGDTRVVPPSIVVPESLLGFAAFALLIPLVTGRKRLLAFVKVRR